LNYQIDLGKNRVEIEIKVNGVLSLITSIAGYSKPKNLNMAALRAFVYLIFHNIDLGMPEVAQKLLSVFCTFVNSITFDFTKREMVIIQNIDFSAIKIDSKLV
jgi:hypothetical protein